MSNPAPAPAQPLTQLDTIRQQRAVCAAAFDAAMKRKETAERDCDRLAGGLAQLDILLSHLTPPPAPAKDDKSFA